MFGFFSRRRRERLRSAPFPADWIGIVERNAPFYASLPETDRRDLQGRIQVFLAEKVFEGCNGLELTDEIRVTIAAHACRLLLRRDVGDFPRLITVLVYPSAYIAKSTESLSGGSVSRGASRCGWARRGRTASPSSRGTICRRPSGVGTPAGT